MKLVVVMLEIISIVSLLVLGVLWVLYPDARLEPYLGLAGTLFALLEVLRQRSGPGKIYFPDNVEQFYKYYAEQTDLAKEEIYLTTDGYNMRNSTSRKYAKIMNKARVGAMKRGATIYWFQIVQSMHINWIDCLLKMKEDNQENMKLFVNENIGNIPNVCVFDPALDTNISETMEHRSGMFGQGSEASTASFTHKDKVKAQKTKEIVLDLIEAPGTIELDLIGLKQLKERLLNDRIEKLNKWQSTIVNGNQNIDISESGVFDEYVISNFVNQKNNHAKTH